ncbi:hypothetical protein SAMN05216368_12126 [Cryobacterium flavum]|uniref:DUF3784 domain-containing protein n=1 Tax=Cryobacterium flavum TaxID=1424659 RepID=A0A4R8V5J7_9MICO|nr:MULTISPECIES: hypothetical protein [Cryobacterium]TFB78095.1 hypothetical protein E3O21_06550 [Cryobacterium flavum]SDO52299.1 hypothetical protein SAMN05216368_12126 [Cryobacterium flavum]
MSAFADEQREVEEPEQPELKNPQVRISMLSGMDVFGWIAAVVGAVGAMLFIASLIRTIRANPDTRIPFNRNPPVLPAGSIAMRSIGAGLLVFGGVALTNAHGTWSMIVVVGVVLVTLAVITVHNHRLTVTANH